MSIENQVENRDLILDCCVLILDSRFVQDSSNRTGLSLVLSNSLSTLDTRLLQNLQPLFKVLSNLLTSLMSEKSFFSINNKLYSAFILVRNFLAMQIQDTLKLFEKFAFVRTARVILSFETLQMFSSTSVWYISPFALWKQSFENNIYSHATLSAIFHHGSRSHELGNKKVHVYHVPLQKNKLHFKRG